MKYLIIGGILTLAIIGAGCNNKQTVKIIASRTEATIKLPTTGKSTCIWDYIKDNKKEQYISTDSVINAYPHIFENNSELKVHCIVEENKHYYDSVRF